MLEVEAKFPLPPAARARVEAELARRGVAFGDPVTQADTYRRHPVRDFAETDEALRVRVVTGSDGVPRGKLTYKGPKLGGFTKTREEFEPALQPGEQNVQALAAALDRLGFAPVRTVTKTRRAAAVDDAGPDGVTRSFHITRDEVEGLGEFLEVETTTDAAPGTPAADGAGAAVRYLAGTLGLGEPEPRSYLELLLGRDAETDAG